MSTHHPETGQHSSRYPLEFGPIRKPGLIDELYQDLVRWTQMDKKWQSRLSCTDEKSQRGFLELARNANLRPELIQQHIENFFRARNWILHSTDNGILDIRQGEQALWIHLTFSETSFILHIHDSLTATIEKHLDGALR